MLLQVLRKEVMVECSDLNWIDIYPTPSKAWEHPKYKITRRLSKPEWRSESGIFCA